MLEDGVQELWRRAKRAKRNGREGQEGEGEEGEGGGKGERIVGYVWTFLFMSWSTAAKEYPQFLIIRKEEVSLRALLFGWWGWWGK